jgi:hypothetical protein
MTITEVPSITVELALSDPRLAYLHEAGHAVMHL